MPTKRERAGTGAITSMLKRANAFWFFIALFGGGAGIWWTKSVFANAWYAAMVAAGVVLALMIYYLLNDENAPEEEGDNVYYLGFLFTLISLMFTLVELFGAGTDAVRNAEKIRVLLENFGIALTSTAVGIAGRVAVQSWQRIGTAGRPEFAEDTAIPAVPPAGASSRDLEMFNRRILERIARDLTRGANALARFHRIVRSHASDTEDFLRNHSETLKRESAEFEAALQRTAETFTQELRSKADHALDTMGVSFGAAAQQAEALLKRLQSAHDDYVADVREVTRSFHDEMRSASGQSLDALQRNFDAATKQSLSLIQDAATVHERIGEAFGTLRSGLGHASDASAAFGNSAHQAARSAVVLELEVDKLRAALAVLHAGTQTMTGMLDAMGEMDARIRAEGAAATEQAAKSAELFDSLTRSVRITEGETRRAAEALRALANEAEARAETLRQRKGLPFGIWNRKR